MDHAPLALFTSIHTANADGLRYLRIWIRCAIYDVHFAGEW